MTENEKLVELVFTPRHFRYFELFHGPPEEDFGARFKGHYLKNEYPIHFWFPTDYVDEENPYFAFNNDKIFLSRAAVEGKQLNLFLETLEFNWEYSPASLEKFIARARLLLPIEPDNGFFFFFG